MLKAEAQALIDELNQQLDDPTVVWQGQRTVDAVKALIRVLSSAEDEVQAVFEVWAKAALAKGAYKIKPKLTEGRRRKITARFHDGYDTQTLKEAAEGWTYSPFHCGENDRRTMYCEVDLIFRDGEKVEGFAELTRQHKRSSMPSSDRCQMCLVSPIPEGGCSVNECPQRP